MEERIYTFKNSDDFNDKAYQKQKLYVIQEAGKFSLIAECLEAYRGYLEHYYQDGIPLNKKESFVRAANSALMDWDI